MKRLVVSCDGTWNKPDNETITNVEKIARTVQSDPRADRRRLPARLLRQRGRRRELCGRPGPRWCVRVRAGPQRDRELPVPRPELRTGRRDLHRRLQPRRLHGALGGRHGRSRGAAHQEGAGRGEAARGGPPVPAAGPARRRVRGERRRVQARPLPPGHGGLPRCVRHGGRPRRTRLHAARTPVPRRPAERADPARPARPGRGRDPAEVRAHVLGGSRGPRGRAHRGRSGEAGVVRGSALRRRRRLPRRPGSRTPRCCGWPARPTGPASSSTCPCWRTTSAAGRTRPAQPAQPDVQGRQLDARGEGEARAAAAAQRFQRRSASASPTSAPCPCAWRAALSPTSRRVATSRRT